jgi:hypothetical protein
VSAGKKKTAKVEEAVAEKTPKKAAKKRKAS